MSTSSIDDPLVTPINQPFFARAGSVQQQLVRLRWLWFAAIAILFILAYNGQWRISPDSALYRALGQNLANGQGYTYLGEPHTHAYPGLPWLLAASRLIFGQDLVPVLVLNLTFAAATLVLIYQTIKEVCPRWVAVAVVMITGTNAQFHTFTAMLLTDVPFLFAVCLTVYAYLKLRRIESSAAALGWGALVLAGIGLAAAFRPAFWVLIVSLLLTIAWEMIHGSKRLAAGLLAGIAIVGGLWIAFDPRQDDGGAVIGGRDESKVLRVLSHPERILTRLADNVPTLLHEHASDAFFGVELGPGIDAAAAVIIFAGGILLVRQQKFWGLLVLVLLGVTLFYAGTVPRYYLMVLPMLALGWVQLIRRLTLWAPWKWRSLCIGLWLALAITPNVVMCGKLIARQRSQPFLATYRHGEWLPYPEMAQAIKAQVPHDQRVIGPRATVLTYLSGRDVVSLREYLRRVPQQDHLRVLIDRRVGYAILPLSAYKTTRPELESVLLALDPPSDTDEPETPAQWRLVKLKFDDDAQAVHIESVIATGQLTGAQ